MKIGLQIPSFSWPGGAKQIAPRLADIAQAAEEAGFASLWVMDHFFQIEGLGPVTDPMLEAYSTLSYLAGVTRRARLGALVTAAIYRHPGVLIKTVSSLDVLSGGRAYFGVGAGWFEREARGLGIPFPSWKERFEKLEETLQIAQRVWSGEVEPYAGEHHRLEEPLNSPQPISRPRPPILVGGMGEKKTLRLVARYADACNFVTHIGLDGLRSKLELLKRHCEVIGRPFEEIERTVLGGIHLAPGEMSVEAVLQQCRSLAGLGFQHFIVNMPNVHEIAPIETIGREVIPVVSEWNVLAAG